MGTKGAQCLSLLEDCLALQLQRAGGSPHLGHHETQQYWIYDSGYLLYQGFVEANLKCRWDGGLTTAVRGLHFRGYIAPGILLVGGSRPALHLLRAAWSRRVLKPPPSYTIALLGDVEDCIVSKVQQTSFTPLSDAVCWVILQLGAAGQNAVLDSIQASLISTFPEMEQPSRHLLYDTLADLMSENKIYQTAQGYFISSHENGRAGLGESSGRQVLLTHAEAAAMASGEIVTIREGAKTHQAIQTNLADVICGGNKSDKVLYARAPVRAPGRKLERRHSMRLLGSSRRLSSLHRAGSVRLLHSNPSTENNQKKCSLFSKLFKWSKRQSSASNNITSSLSVTFPPHEWFNSTVLGLHSVGTQTKTLGRGDGDWSECGSIRSRRRSLSTSRLPRRQTRLPSVSPSRPSPSSTPTSSKTALTTTPKALSSASSGYNSLPRPHKSKTKILQSNSPSPRRTPSNSIKVELSASPSSITTDTKVDTHMTASINDPSATMTTTINGPNSTKIYVQQQNSPIRSVITFEKSRKSFNEIGKDDGDRSEKTLKSDLKRVRRPSSLYQQRERENTKESIAKNNVNVEQLSNNIKMKFPSTETIIQMEEKLLVHGNKNNNNECQKKNLYEHLKTGSLIDVADCSEVGGRMNNIRKASASLTPLQPSPSTDKVLESLSYKNVLKESLTDSATKNEDKNICYNSNNKLQSLEKTIELAGKKERGICSFPSLSDLSLHFTSIAAQNILNGVSINSLDTLVETNEKNNLKDMSIHTDMGIV